MLFRFTFVLLMAALIAACGGGSDEPTPTPAPTPTNPTPVACTPATTVTPLPNPTVVAVTGGDVSSIDVNVTSPAACPPLNAELLGVAELTGTGSAGSNGDVIRRGATKRVLLFGAGLSGSLNVTISGPPDIVISNIRGITSNDSTPGVAFDVVVGPSAALGARTVILRAPNSDVTTFTGGLEVLP